jgi:hypothetical protein
MLAVGGWIGISYNEPRIDKLAAVIFGAGGGLIADEVGILLTFQGEYYWTGISYTFTMILLAFVSVLVLLNKYSKGILRDFIGFSGTRWGFYLAAFVAAISIAFLIDTENLVIIGVSGTLTIVACVIILSFFIQAIRRKIRRK